jgi:26S proteasome regulatory subunit N9
LTLTLQEFVAAAGSGPFLVPLYQNVISEFESKLNPLSLVDFLVKAARQMTGPMDALQFLSSKHDRLKNKEALFLLTMETAHYQLATGDVAGCKKAMDDCGKLLETELSTMEPLINASYFRVSADYYKAKADYPQYYKNALLFLSSVSLEDLSQADKVQRAHDLALSALLGDGLYNFGELVSMEMI